MNKELEVDTKEEIPDEYFDEEVKEANEVFASWIVDAIENEDKKETK